MKSLESLETDNSHISCINNSGAIDEEDESNLINRYEVKKDNDNVSNYLRLTKKNQKKLPLLFYVFILSLLILLACVMIYIFTNKKPSYTYEIEPIEKPGISEFNYSKIIFNNGLEVLLVKVGMNDTAGGSIIFDTGYLDNSYEYGYLHKAFLTLLGNDDDIKSSSTLKDYLGSFASSSDEYHYSFSFDIINAGFFKYLSVFKNLAFFEDNDKRLDRISKTINLNSLHPGLLGNEKMLLEYYIYGYKNVSKRTISSFNNDKIKEIIKSLVQPNKMKIVLASHFKLSLVKKQFINIFKDIINVKVNESEKQTSTDNESIRYNDKYFTTKKVILFTSEHESNYYLKIIFFVNKKENESYYDFIKKLGYFRYIKYILDATGEGSLYHELANPTNENFTIKSLSCNYEIVLQKKIKFSIQINLAPSSIEYLEEISKIAYEYINNYIVSINGKDEIYKDLYKQLKTIVEQEFTFMEDSDETIPFTKKLGINLCDHKTNSSFFKDSWIEPFNFEEMKIYFSQLIPNNSVIILLLNNEYSQTVINKSIFNLSKKYYISRTPHYISDLNINITTKSNCTLNIKENNYISKHTKGIEIEEKSEDNKKLSAEIINKTNLRVFKFLRETKFRLPKVHIMLNLFHPFFRPGNKTENKNNSHCLYFEYMLYLTYIELEINKILADAIRAGNKISVGYTHMNTYINVFAFSDVAKEIIEEIKKILMNKSDFAKIHDSNNINKYMLYKESTFEDHLNIWKVRPHIKAKYLLIYGLNERTYKNYEFPFINETQNIENICNTIFDNNKEFVINFILDCQIYGYYNKEEANEIVKIFNETPTDEENFKNVVNNAGIENNINASNFISWIKNFGELTEAKTIIGNDETVRKQAFTYIYWSNYSISNMIKSKLFWNLVDDYNKKDTSIPRISFIEYNSIFMQIRYMNLGDTKNFLKNISQIKSEIKGKIQKKYEEKMSFYKEDIDVVGDRFYYLKKNLIEEQYSRRAKMEKSATATYNSDFYVADDLSELESESISKLDYPDIIEIFNSIYNKSNFDIIYN